ncbi:MAG: A/G-specific adenine glycosylase [Proteobacteria bacterium]|nr:A/G-specific adenine glycosylase [Pseudomonadota bacterium]
MFSSNHWERIQHVLLHWYDTYQRHFPWRATSAQKLDPYYTLLSEIMLQQTTVTTVIPYFEQFTEKFPTIQELAKASLDEIYHIWQGLGYYKRAFNLHKCAKLIVEKYGGLLPDQEQELLTLPGIGPYTASAIASIAFDRKTLPIDGNIARVLSRLYLIKTPLPHLIRELQKKQLKPHTRPGDLAQSFMDLGATLCTTRPKCLLCPLVSQCAAYNKEDPEDFPFRLKKKLKPTRYGLIFWSENEKGEVFIQKRLQKGLLEGLMEFPNTPWQEKPFVTPLKILGEVHHTFSHFHLRLTIVKSTAQTSEGFYIHPENFKNYALSTLMKKVANVALGATKNIDENIKYTRNKKEEVKVSF